MHQKALALEKSLSAPERSFGATMRFLGAPERSLGIPGLSLVAPGWSKRSVGGHLGIKGGTYTPGRLLGVPFGSYGTPRRSDGASRR